MSSSYFENLECWQKSRAFKKKLYLLVQDWPDVERFGLISQVQRACVSVTANIAEGCGRDYDGDMIRFIRIARGSAYEVLDHLYTAFDLGYVKESDFKVLRDDVYSIIRLISGYIRYLDTSQQT